ncbi:hypothetical protein ES319_D08G081500v1 [Gossypium barbadense]|uniref:Uncharacterized protein n=1 Tax=Gossypium barbadense TaxID=3634 RepID=A0A5J5QAU0_GOSBA|nr:hypothetical protein ES319_D08G081500v1 [Gossypium barbadense]
MTQAGGQCYLPATCLLHSYLQLLSSYKMDSKFSTASKQLQVSESSFSTRSMKGRSWQRCSKQIREQRARLYIVWRCTVLLLCWHD